MTTRKYATNPPTLRELLRDPLYRTMFTTPPDVSHLLTRTPWSIYLLLEDGRWAGGKLETYQDAFNKAKLALKKPYRDIAIVSNIAMWPPPVKYMWQTSKFDWCGRCRRPSTFKHNQGLHALRGATILTTDEALRCFYCGVRRIMMERYLYAKDD